MTEIKLYAGDNMEILPTLPEKMFNLIYADMVYENPDLSWLDICKELLAPNGVIMVQTDCHTVADVYAFHLEFDLLTLLAIFSL